MRKIVLTSLAALSLAAFTTEIATAAEPHHAHKAHATASRQFRNANAAVVAPAPSSELGVYSGGWSAPAGH